MKRLTTLALLAGILSAPALHGEEVPADHLAPLNFPQPDAVADSVPGEGSSPVTTPAPTAAESETAGGASPPR